MTDGGDSMNTEEFLAHHGVKGMRWGHRKEKETNKKMKFLNKAIASAERDASHWKSVAKSTEKYLQEEQERRKKNPRYAIDPDGYDWFKEDQKINKKQLAGYRKHARDWMKTLKNLKSMSISEMTVREVKKKTKRNYLINEMING